MKYYRVIQNIIEHFIIQLSVYTETSAFCRLFTNFMVIIYFPYCGNALICSRATAEDIPYLVTILNNTFKEKPITFKYCISGQIFDSPQIIISMANPNTIPLEDGKMLGSQFKVY